MDDTQFARHQALYERDDTYDFPDGRVARYNAIRAVIEVTAPENYHLDGDGEAWGTVYDLLDMVEWLRGKYVPLRMEMEQVRSLLPNLQRSTEDSEMRERFINVQISHILGEEGDR